MCVRSAARRVPYWPATDGRRKRDVALGVSEMDDGIRRGLQVKRCTCSHCLPVTKHTQGHGYTNTLAD